MKPMLKPPGTKHLKLKCDILLSTFAFKTNLRRYIQATPAVYELFAALEDKHVLYPAGAPAHSSNSLLHLSRICH